MARACTVCTSPDRTSIDRDLLSGTPYRAVGKRYGVGTSAVFRHKRDHLTELMARAAKARGARDLEYGDDLLGQLVGLNGRAMSILDDAEASGDRRAALGAIREVQSLPIFQASSRPFQPVSKRGLTTCAVALQRESVPQHISGAWSAMQEPILATSKRPRSRRSTTGSLKIGMGG